MARAEIKPRFKQFFAIDETVGLHKNYSFRLAILLPIASCLFLVGLFSWQLHQNGLYNFHFTQPGITDFVKYFSFPISLLSLSIVFGVMVARFHSSKQKAKSNEITERNNSVNYFYKTHEEFEKFCAKLVRSRKTRFSRIRADRFYSVFFSSSSPNSPSLYVHDSFFRAINSFYGVYINNLIEYLGSDDFNKAKQSTTRGIGPKYNFSSGLDMKLNKLGLEITFIGYFNELKEVEDDLFEFYNSIIELFSFPGLENRLDSIERLNKDHLRWIAFLNTHPKFLEFKALQARQS